ncbi:MAG: alanine--tRNA ligase, partial [Methanobacterium sp.]
VVDTGYGLERFAWISQGTPTAYDASFGPVIQTLKELSGVEVDERILAENAQVAGMMDIETFADLRELRSKVADRLNISLDDLERATKPMEAIYVIADHTRCLAFMLADGVIPSNVKEGYLARLVLRRTIRFIKELGLKESLADIMRIQLDFLSKTYPEIRQSQDHIINVINLEDKRYDKTVSKGRELVKRSIKKLRKKNKTEMPFETLKELYESHGIPPETTKEISEKMEFEVKVPDNFYTLVAAEHEEEAQEEKAEIELEFPATDLLFYQKPFDTQFEAHVLGTYENNVVLDQTVFYPEGGGQPSDIGYLEIRGEKIKVLHAEKVNNTVLHRVAEDDIEKVHPYKGQVITGQIDISRRMALTRNHTATHLIVAAARKILGDHIWQAGAQKGVKKSRIDLTHYKRIEPEELQEIELLANKFVMENRPVLTNWMARAEAEKKYGFILYQGGIVPGMDIRTVVVGGIDVQACAGTHCNQTGDIGLIKITKTERIQDGVERIEFSAGEAAIEAAQRNDNILKESSDVFKVTSEQLPKTCDRFFNEWKSFKNEINKLKGEIASLKTDGILNKTEKIGDLVVLSEIIDSDMNELIKMATDLTEKQGKVDV